MVRGDLLNIIELNHIIESFCESPDGGLNNPSWLRVVVLTKLSHRFQQIGYQSELHAEAFIFKSAKIKIVSILLPWVGNRIYKLIVDLFHCKHCEVVRHVKSLRIVLSASFLLQHLPKDTQWSYQRNCLLAINLNVLNKELHCNEFDQLLCLFELKLLLKSLLALR